MTYCLKKSSGAVAVMTATWVMEGVAMVMAGGVG